MTKNIMDYPSVSFDWENNRLEIIDQTQLPETIEILKLTTQQEIFQAIYLLKVRGAPAIGVAAAYGLYLGSLEIEADDFDGFYKEFQAKKAYLDSARPTAVNLSWALKRMEQLVLSHGDAEISELKKMLGQEAKAIHDEDIWMCKSIGEYGLTVIQDGDGILTHCNAGQLATSKYGTALAPIHLGVERGMKFKVFTDETRPLLQGARLSSFELHAHGVDTTLICDSMASVVMKNGWVQAVFVGCDRVTANGDVANKIGTAGVAILAKHYGIPFYVLGPTSTIDMSLDSGADIPIEERPGEEITEMWYRERMAPRGVKTFNPAFDVTDHQLIAGIITEYGIARPPYRQSLQDIFQKKTVAQQK